MRRRSPKAVYCFHKPKKIAPKPRKSKPSFSPYIPKATVNDERIEQLKQYKSVTSGAGVCSRTDRITSTKHTVAIPYNKGGMQVIPESDIEWIGK